LTRLFLSGYENASHEDFPIMDKPKKGSVAPQGPRSLVSA
jgi:hypothetical protein